MEKPHKSVNSERFRDNAKLSGQVRLEEQVHTSIIRHIGVAIVGGTFKPGEILPTEGEFSERLSVSRNAYREAIRYLSAKGLVESRRKSGTRVSPRERWRLLDPDVLDWFFEASPSEVFIRSLIQLRLIIEPPAAELAARNRSEDHLSEMHSALSDMRLAPLGTFEGRKAGARFHRTVLAASGNELLLSLASSVDAAMQWTLIYFRQLDASLPDPFDEHERLLKALVVGDTAAAREIMRAIVVTGYRGTDHAMSLPL